MLKLLCLLLLIVSGNALGQESQFRWLSAGKDEKLLQSIRYEFRQELQPDNPVPGSIPLTVKYIHRVALFGDSALVIVGHKENQTDPYPLFKAYSFNVSSRRKTLIQRSAGKRDDLPYEGWLSMWKFSRLARFGPSMAPDVVFTFRSCTECESVSLLSSFRFSEERRLWELRDWGGGYVVFIGSDTQIGDDGVYDYDCLNTIRDFSGDGFDDLAVRCRETVEPEAERKKGRVIKDEILLYSFRDEQATRNTVRRGTTVWATVQKALCERGTDSPLCAKAPSKTRSARH
jgi:hypothetical protein